MAINGCSALLAAAIAIGIGVGIWRHREHSSLSPPDATVTPHPNITRTRAAQYILDDTSLAAMALPNDDRQLFFQDNTGLLRRAVRTVKNSKWSTSSRLDFNFNAKNYTPLAVTFYNNSDEKLGYETTLYYVSKSHVLVSLLHSGVTWLPDPGLTMCGTAVNTRSLSVTSAIVNSTRFSLLYYENPTGKVSALLQRTNNDLYDAPWIDITSQEVKSLPNEFRNAPDSVDTQHSKTLYEAQPNITLSTPFTCGSSHANKFGSYLQTVFYVRPKASAVNGGPPASGGFFFSTYEISPSGLGQFAVIPFSAMASDVFNESLFHRSDIAWAAEYVIWINGTQPTALNDPNGLKTLHNTFPFKRLATSVSADRTTTYLYHQINGTTFAEEQYDGQINAWLAPEYITITDP